VSSAGTVTRGDRRPAHAGVPRRLLLLSESAGLAAVLTCLLEPRDRLTRSAWSDEAAERARLADADLVVLDVPRDARAAVLAQLRGRYHGPVVVLVERGDKGAGLPPDRARTLLARPFSTDNLRAALSLPAPEARPPEATPPEARPSGVRRAPSPAGPPPRADATTAPAALAGKAATLVAPRAGTGEIASLFPPAGDRGRAGERGVLSVDGKAFARVAPPRVGAPPTGAAPPGRRPLGVLLADLAHGWRSRRMVRIAGFSALAAVAFMVAFALAAQGRCGPGCDDLTRIAPVTTLPAADSPLAPTTAVRRLPPSTTVTTPPGGGLRGVPGGVLGSTTSTTRRATTTSRASSRTTRPTTPTTKPPTTPTTGPTTTETTAPTTTAPPVT
jgi:hypothetical protein